MNGIAGFLPFILLIGVFYFLLIRPQQKKAQKHKALLKEVEPGDEVVTIGGLFGDVVELDENRVLLELYDGTQAEFLRSAISRRVVPEDDQSGDSDNEIDVTDREALEAASEDDTADAKKS